MYTALHSAALNGHHDVVVSLLDNYADIWAFGVVIWELFSRGKLPYKGVKNFASWVMIIILLF